MANPEVTVVIPTFNDGKYLHEALGSLEKQTFKNFEVIIVDDASNDKESIDAINSLKQKSYSYNLKVIELEKNSGPAVARNRGIKAANGKYILPLDADDKIAPSYIEKAKKILDTKSEIGIVYCEAELFGEMSGKWDLQPYSFPEILVGNMIFATALFRKSDWKKVGGYNEDMHHGNEDYDFWLSLLELGVGVYQIPEILFSYRIKEHSRTRKLQNENREVQTYLQIYNNHKSLYLAHIDIFFKELYNRQKLIEQKNIKIEEIIDKKNIEIRDAHKIIHQKNIEIRDAHKIIHQKNIEIRDAHEIIHQKNIEIRDVHEILQKKDLNIMGLHKKLQEAAKRIDEAGRELQYTQEVVEYKDQLLEAMRIKNRVKKLFNKLNPFAKREATNKIEPPKRVKGYQYTTPIISEEIAAEIDRFKNKPLLSIVMPVYNVDVKWLQKAVESVERQWYKNWELCIADDKSTNKGTLDYLNSITNPQIKIKFLNENLNIAGATNAALELASGEYIVLMDNDDEITPDALYEIVKRINESDADFIYSDEDFIDMEDSCRNPHFKPDFSPDMLLTNNYITHLSCFRKSLLDKVGGFDRRFDGSQDYDLFLRLTEHTDKIEHISKVLYHWRTLESSTSVNAEAKPEAIERSRMVLEETLKRRGIDGWVEHGNLPHYFRVRYRIKDNPLVSIVIPFKDKPELLDMCINSILKKSTYQNYEIIGISNNSTNAETFEMMQQLEAKDSRVSFYEYNVPFNYANINNHAVNLYSKGEHILLLNNDIEVIAPEWIEAMLEHSQREEIGCVGAKLYYPNDTIQHAGIIMGLGGYAGHSHKMYPRGSEGYFNRLNAIQNVSAVTAACLMVKKRIYQEVGGMDEINFKVAYNDVDFCLRVLEKGYRNLFTPYAELYHHESISRGYETTPEKIARFQKEKDALSARHSEILNNGDPFYNPNLTHDKEDFSVALKE
jgi:glycosyltransferase involved in cell wall biosynthesis